MAEFGTSYVKSFLEKCELETYYERFLSQGFKDLLDLCLIGDNDLIDLCIVDESNRERILSEGQFCEFINESVIIGPVELS